MARDTSDPLDVAIIGGGVSGLYSAWRITADPAFDGRNVAVFESSDRLGGRLWSVDLRDEEAVPAELGGMFFSDAQPLVYNLCTSVLGLDTQTVSPRPDFAYLRDKRFRIEDFPKPGVLPYHLNPDEKGKPYHELLFLALRRIVPDLDQYWPLNADGRIEDTVSHLRSVKFEGRELYRWGFWNLLAKVLSNEAYLCLRDVVSSFALFSNWNAYDATFSLLNDLSGQWFKLPKGYQRLPEALASEAEKKGVRLHRQTRAVAIDDADERGLLRVALHSDGAEHSVLARRIILALPKFAIESLSPSSIIFRAGQMSECLSAVGSVPACKIFLTFDKPWWRTVPEGPGKVGDGTFAASHTDLPMRQCYYLGVDPKTGEGLVLASYSDAQSVPFWSALMTGTGRSSGLSTPISQTARDEIRRQLSAMHGVDVPPPRDGIFVNWSAAPYGGGWHAWLPGWKSYDVMATLRRPDADRPIHVCGESVCAYQGWVEGALTSAEVMLQKEFDLDNPDWFTSGASLAPYAT